MTKDPTDALNAWLAQDHPMACKFQELHQNSSTLAADDRVKFMQEWKQANPDQSQEMKQFLEGFDQEFKK